MKKLVFTLMFLVLVIVPDSDAATTWFKGYRFEARVLSNSKGVLGEHKRGSRPYIHVREGDEYSIIVRNPLPVRVAVAVSVDGLNIIDGKRSSPGNSGKWIIGPYSSITLRGWQTGNHSLRRFVFTRAKYSYAKWKEKHDRRRYTHNLGVIGVAYFWNSRELYRALNPPQPFADKEGRSESLGSRSRKKAAQKSPSAARAGTGMGRQQYNRVKRIKFNYDTGMYASRQVLKIFYEFGRHSRPSPFVDDDGFAPDMYRNPNRNNRYHGHLSMTRKLILLAKIRNLQVVLYQYYADQGAYPNSLRDLVKMRYIWQIPDPANGRWIYNKKTGKVKHSLI